MTLRFVNARFQKNSVLKRIELEAFVLNRYLRLSERRMSPKSEHQSNPLVLTLMSETYPG